MIRFAAWQGAIVADAAFLAIEDEQQFFRKDYRVLGANLSLASGATNRLAFTILAILEAKTIGGGT
jgi:hypothetical protein